MDLESQRQRFESRPPSSGDLGQLAFLHLKQKPYSRCERPRKEEQGPSGTPPETRLTRAQHGGGQERSGAWRLRRKRGDTSHAPGSQVRLQDAARCQPHPSPSTQPVLKYERHPRQRARTRASCRGLFMATSRPSRETYEPHKYEG